MRRKRKGFAKLIERRDSSAYRIQVTSMVGLFVILLVFLLKSYNTSSIQVDLGAELELPKSSSFKDPIEALKLVVSRTGIYVNDERVINLKEGNILEEDLDVSDSFFISPLFAVLDQQAKQAQRMADLNESFQFEGKVLMQADRNLPYDLLRRVMYTSMMAGFADVKIAVFMNE